MNNDEAKNTKGFEELFEIELVEDTGLEASRILPAPGIEIAPGGGGEGQSNSNCSSNNAADMP